MKNGRARVSSLTEWLSAHPGRAAVRSLALETLPPPEPAVHVSRSNRARGALSSLLGRALGRRVSPDPHRDASVG